jgi:hypothetical protein
MIGFHPRKFTIALLAQIVFCLVAAPILAAERWAVPLAVSAAATTGDHPENSPRDSRPLIQAAFDASDVRPEEVSDASQKRTKSRSKTGRSSGTRPGGNSSSCAVTADESTSAIESAEIAGQESLANQDRTPASMGRGDARLLQAVAVGVKSLYPSFATFSHHELAFWAVALGRENRLATLAPEFVSVLDPATEKFQIRHAVPARQPVGPPMA